MKQHSTLTAAAVVYALSLGCSSKGELAINQSRLTPTGEGTLISVDPSDIVVSGPTTIHPCFSMRAWGFNPVVDLNGVSSYTAENPGFGTDYGILVEAELRTSSGGSPTTIRSVDSYIITPEDVATQVTNFAGRRLVVGWDGTDRSVTPAEPAPAGQNSLEVRLRVQRAERGGQTYTLDSESLNGAVDVGSASSRCDAWLDSYHDFHPGNGVVEISSQSTGVNPFIHWKNTYPTVIFGNMYANVGDRLATLKAFIDAYAPIYGMSDSSVLDTLVVTREVTHPNGTTSMNLSQFLD